MMRRHANIEETDNGCFIVNSSDFNPVMGMHTDSRQAFSNIDAALEAVRAVLQQPKPDLRGYGRIAAGGIGSAYPTPVGPTALRESDVKRPDW